METKNQEEIALVFFKTNSLDLRLVPQMFMKEVKLSLNSS